MLPTDQPYVSNNDEGFHGWIQYEAVEAGSIESLRPALPQVSRAIEQGAGSDAMVRVSALASEAALVHFDRLKPCEESSRPELDAKVSIKLAAREARLSVRKMRPSSVVRR